MKTIVVFSALLFLGACGFTPEGNFIRGAVKAQGAKAYDEGLKNAEWYICEAASIGSIKRRYGGDRSGAYNDLCDHTSRDIVK